jgi:C-terminal processing protease CtpA/Prc
MTQDMNQREVSLLVVDMRYNGGGNSLLGNMLLEALNIHLSIFISYGNTTNTKKALDYMVGRA